MRISARVAPSDIITKDKGTTMRTKEHSQGDREASVFNRNLMHKLIVGQILIKRSPYSYGLMKSITLMVC